MRTWDAMKVGEGVQFICKDADPIEWLSNPVNIALENEHGDVALFEYAFPGKTIYSGHYYFKSRGRQAIRSARDFLDELFNSCYNISILMGLVPLTNKASRWITRQIGFVSYGTDEIHGQSYELFIMTKKEFNDGSNYLRRL